MPMPGFEIRELAPGEAAPWADFTFPAYRDLLVHGKGAADTEPLAIAATQQGTRAGLLLAVANSASSPERKGELLSLLVAPEFRRHGCAAALVHALAGRARARGLQSLSTTYTAKDSEFTAAVEAILRGAGWSAPEPQMLVAKCLHTVVVGADPVWLRPMRSLSGSAVIPWRETTVEQRNEAAISDQQEPWIAPDLRPSKFANEGPFDLNTSMAYLVDGRLRGWMLTHALSPTLLRFTCSFVHPALQRHGPFFHMLRRIISSMPEFGFTAGIWTVPVFHTAMCAFVQRHMRPVAEYIRETRLSRLAL